MALTRELLRPGRGNVPNPSVLLLLMGSVALCSAQVLLVGNVMSTDFSGPLPVDPVLRSFLLWTVSFPQQLPSRGL